MEKENKPVESSEEAGTETQSKKAAKKQAKEAAKAAKVTKIGRFSRKGFDFL